MNRDYIPPSRRKPSARNARNSRNARNTRVKPSRKSIPGWIWMLGGILVGALVTGIINIGGDEPDGTETEIIASGENLEAEEVVAAKDTKTGEPHKPRFD